MVVHAQRTGVFHFCHAFFLKHAHTALVSSFANLTLCFLVTQTVILPNFVVNPSKKLSIGVGICFFES